MSGQNSFRNNSSSSFHQFTINLSPIIIVNKKDITATEIKTILGSRRLLQKLPLKKCIKLLVHSRFHSVSVIFYFQFSLPRKFFGVCFWHNVLKSPSDDFSDNGIRKSSFSDDFLVIDLFIEKNQKIGTKKLERFEFSRSHRSFKRT